jgi:hypothetical protein
MERPPGAVAEWLGRGLQSLVHRFESGPRLFSPGCGIITAVASFRAHVAFQFESESLEAAGQALRRLQQAARAAGFELETGRVDPWEPDAPSGGSGTPYGPLDSEDAAED